MRDLHPVEGDVVEIDGRGCSAVPGLVDCHTHACFGGDRVEEFSLRAGGASYEELHARGGGILSTVRATRAASPYELAGALGEHVGWMRQAGTTTFEAKSGYGLDHDTELAQLRAVVDAGGVATWLGAHAVSPEFVDQGADAYVEFSSRRCSRSSADRRGATPERGPSTPTGRLISRVSGLACAAPRRPVHGVGSDPGRDRLGARRSTTRGDR
jgi:imidazolonepropionase